MIGKYFALRKAKNTWLHVLKLYGRKAKSLDSYNKGILQAYLKNLQGAILRNETDTAHQLSHELAQTAQKLMPRSAFDRVRDFFGKTLFALLVAVLIRTMWFELYTIPTGSMRPTLKEQDFLVVSKTNYGVNVPLQASHFYFDPSLVQRGAVIVFNGENMDIEDADTMYFYLFPGKKQFVKRLIGKPGDTLYFYGGDLYGVDGAGQPINLQEVNRVEHIPFIRFDGKVEAQPAPNSPLNGLFSPALLHQMNQPVARLNFSQIGTIQGELLKDPLSHYSDLWGMKHFAMARLLTKAQKEQLYPNSAVGDGLLYLELTHHPTLQGASLIRDEYNRLRPGLATSVSLLPLQEKHLDAIAAHMTTARFVVKNGVAHRYGWSPRDLGHYLPRLPQVPDGTYEIQDGTVYKLPFTWLPIFGGYAYKVASNHPLYKKSPEQIHLLYNLGIEWLNHYAPSSKAQRLTPSRYAYFKNQALHLMGGPVLAKDDPILLDFHKREAEKKSISTTVNPYFPFADAGPPSLDEIKKHGLRIPDKMYLALGDNHAMSADSRQFGFVPEDNLKGSVSFLFSPPGERLGRAPQPAHPFLTLPNIVIWTAFLLISAIAAFCNRRKLRSPLQF
jgi:signal peptidase I